jgi:signal transduction histidine kinase
MILATQTAINEHKEALSLINVIETIKNNLHTQIVESSAMIISDIASDNDTLYTIKSYLQSILYNLVSNSIKYRSDNRNPIIRISCIKQKERTVISVVDNGNGIDLAMFQKQLFGLYKRFDLSKEGRGLGLHMTKTQVEALGGEIKVESELGKGTTFTITLPN